MDSFRVTVEVLAFVGISVPLLRIYAFPGNYEPTRLGFFCDDASLKHPFVRDSISSSECFAIWAALSLSVVVSVELLHHFVVVVVQEEVDRRRRLATVVAELYRVAGSFVLGAVCTMLTTEYVKATVGSLRPNFLTVCKPSLTRDNCTDSNGFGVYVRDYECDPTADPKDVIDARKSYFSGHTSSSFYCATYLIVYLNVRLDCGKRPSPNCLFGLFNTLRPFVQFGIFFLASHISVSRLKEFKHRLSDVVAGGLFGFTVAVLVITFTCDLTKKPRATILSSGLHHNDVEGGERKKLSPSSSPTTTQTSSLTLSLRQMSS